MWIHVAMEDKKWPKENHTSVYPKYSANPSVTTTSAPSSHPLHSVWAPLCFVPSKVNDLRKKKWAEKDDIFDQKPH